MNPHASCPLDRAERTTLAAGRPPGASGYGPTGADTPALRIGPRPPFRPQRGPVPLHTTGPGLPRDALGR